MAGERHHHPILKRGAARFAIRVLRRQEIVVATLVLLAAVQGGVICKRWLGNEARDGEIKVGDDLSELSLRRGDGSLVGLGGDRKTLLLVFDPDCAHSDRVAAGWREWLDAAGHGGNKVFALHAGSRSLAEAYAVEQRWAAEVVSLGRGVDRSGVHALTRRTPWVFAIDEDGFVVASGHGHKLQEVARALILTAQGRHIAVSGRNWEIRSPNERPASRIWSAYGRLVGSSEGRDELPDEDRIARFRVGIR